MLNKSLSAITTYDFDLPNDLIAQVALPDREQSRLLVKDRQFNITYKKICDLDSLIPEGSLIVVNNSKVFPSRLYGNIKTGSKIEVLLLEKIQCDDNQWLAFGKPMRKLKIDSEIIFDNKVRAKVINTSKDTGSVAPFSLKFNIPEKELHDWLDQNAHVPLPPYIKRKDRSEQILNNDKSSYQTIYAEKLGSVAAPTAGLHFTNNLMTKLQKKNVDFASVTLHVGAGTFLPVSKNNIDEHVMHYERFIIPSITLEKILKAKEEKREIVVVGTTSFRCLEALYQISNRNVDVMMDNTNKLLKTNLFIRPTIEELIYKPWAATCLMTNFHQPKSTLFMLVCALFGIDKMQSIYKTAIQNQYRFFSFGDSCLLWI